MTYIVDPSRYGPGWYVVEMNRQHVMRGPYKHSETACAVRREIEDHANERQASLWNLGIVRVTAAECSKATAEKAEKGDA